jgi:cyanophycinase
MPQLQQSRSCCAKFAKAQRYSLLGGINRSIGASGKVHQYKLLCSNVWMLAARWVAPLPERRFCHPLWTVEALADPYDRRITISDSFLSLPYMTPLVADMHFVSRDRLGRLLVFLARLHEDGRAPQRGGSSPLASMGAVGGIGVDEHTALLIDRSGVASIVGVGTAYFILLQPDTSRTCQRNVPVSLGAMPTYRLSADSGGRFDLSLWRGNGGFHYNLSVVAGRIIGGQQDGGY